MNSNISHNIVHLIFICLKCECALEIFFYAYIICEPALEMIFMYDFVKHIAENKFLQPYGMS